MPVEMSEIRLPEINDAVSFAHDQGCDVEAQYIQHTLSHLVRRDDELVGVALCAGIKGLPHTKLFICSNGSMSDEEVQELTNKAMMKLHTAKMSKFEIKLFGGVKDKSFWPMNNWLIHLDEAEDESKEHETECETEFDLDAELEVEVEPKVA